MQDNFLKADFETVTRRVERLTREVYGFLLVCKGGDSLSAEEITLQFLAHFSKEYDLGDSDFPMELVREELLRAAWQNAKSTPLVTGIEAFNYPYFFQLGLKERAVLYLRQRLRLPYASIIRILGGKEEGLRGDVAKARAIMLGRELSPPEWGFRE